MMENKIGEKAFAEGVAEKIKQYLPPKYENVECKVLQQRKNNGVIQAGIHFVRPDQKITPLLYVGYYYQDERKRYERNRRRRSKTFQDLDYICCSSYGRPRSKDFHWTHYKKLLQENDLPNIRWHDLRSTFCTLLLKNNFNPKAVSQLMGHAKEIVTVDVYGDTAEIIEDCLDEMQPFIDEVLPKEETEQNTDFSEEDYVDCMEALLA